MTDRELRLRQRIDQLADERDHALEQLARAREQRNRWRWRSYMFRKQATLWRLRALKR
jgi:hypothetical protein